MCNIVNNIHRVETTFCVKFENMTIKEQIINELSSGGKINMSKLSRDSGISRGTLYKWMKGDCTEMGDAKIERILEAIGMEAIIIRRRG